MEKSSDKKFSFLARIKSSNHAWRGLDIFFKTCHNAWMYVIFLFFAVYLGIYFKISDTEWLFIVLTAGVVLISEAINSAIEIDIDLTSPNYHPYARDTKDVAAGAVLLSVIMAIIIGAIIFIPKILALLTPLNPVILLHPKIKKPYRNW